MRIELYIPTKPLSRNIKNNAVIQAYKAEVRDILRDRYPDIRIPDTIEKVYVGYIFGISNPLADIDNLQKYTQDAIFEYLGVNDRIVSKSGLGKKEVDVGDEFTIASIRPFYDEDYYRKLRQVREAEALENARQGVKTWLKRELYLLKHWSKLTGDIPPREAIGRAIPLPNTLEKDDWWDLYKHFRTSERLIVWLYPDCDKKKLNDFVEKLPFFPRCQHGIANQWEWGWKRSKNGAYSLKRFCGECSIESSRQTPQAKVPLRVRRAAYLWEDGQKTDIQPRNEDNPDTRKPERVPKAQTQRELFNAIKHAISQLTHQHHGVVTNRLYAKLAKRHCYPLDALNISLIEEKGLLSDLLDIAWETYKNAESQGPSL